MEETIVVEGTSFELKTADLPIKKNTGRGRLTFNKEGSGQFSIHIRAGKHNWTSLVKKVSCRLPKGGNCADTLLLIIATAKSAKLTAPTQRVSLKLCFPELKLKFGRVLQAAGGNVEFPPGYNPDDTVGGFVQEKKRSEAPVPHAHQSSRAAATNSNPENKEGQTKGMATKMRDALMDSSIDFGVSSHEERERKRKETNRATVPHETGLVDIGDMNEMFSSPPVSSSKPRAIAPGVEEEPMDHKFIVPGQRNIHHSPKNHFSPKDNCVPIGNGRRPPYRPHGGVRGACDAASESVVLKKVEEELKNKSHISHLTSGVTTYATASKFQEQEKKNAGPSHCNPTGVDLKRISNVLSGRGETTGNQSTTSVRNNNSSGIGIACPFPKSNQQTYAVNRQRSTRQNGDSEDPKSAFESILIPSSSYNHRPSRATTTSSSTGYGTSSDIPRSSWNTHDDLKEEQGLLKIYANECCSNQFDFDVVGEQVQMEPKKQRAITPVPKSKYKFRGLINPHNHCYMNSVLQVVCSRPEFARRLTECRSKMGQMTTDLFVLMSAVCRRLSIPVGMPNDDLREMDLNRLNQIREYIAVYNDSFRSTRQQDAQELFGSLLDAIDEETCGKRKKIEEKGVDESVRMEEDVKHTKVIELDGKTCIIQEIKKEKKSEDGNKRTNTLFDELKYVVNNNKVADVAMKEEVVGGDCEVKMEADINPDDNLTDPDDLNITMQDEMEELGEEARRKDHQSPIPHLGDPNMDATSLDHTLPSASFSESRTRLRQNSIKEDPDGFMPPRMRTRSGTSSKRRFIFADIDDKGNEVKMENIKEEVEKEEPMDVDHHNNKVREEEDRVQVEEKKPNPLALPTELNPAELFKMHLIYERTCLKCNASSTRTEANYFQTLSIEDSDERPSLQYLLDSVFHEELIDYKCDRCSNPQAMQGLKFSEMPSYLMLMVKRYKYDIASGQSKRLDMPVAIDAQIEVGYVHEERTSPKKQKEIIDLRTPLMVRSPRKNTLASIQIQQVQRPPAPGRQCGVAAQLQFEQLGQHGSQTASEDMFSSDENSQPASQNVFNFPLLHEQRGGGAYIVGDEENEKMKGAQMEESHVTPPSPPNVTKRRRAASKTPTMEVEMKRQCVDEEMRVDGEAFPVSRSGSKCSISRRHLNDTPLRPKNNRVTDEPERAFDSPCTRDNVVEDQMDEDEDVVVLEEEREENSTHHRDHRDGEKEDDERNDEKKGRKKVEEEKMFYVNEEQMKWVIMWKHTVTRLLVESMPVDCHLFRPIQSRLQSSMCHILGMDYFDSGPAKQFPKKFGSTRNFRPTTGIAEKHGIDGDGNCLFRSLAFWITGGSQREHAILRKHICNFVEIYAQHFHCFLRQDEDLEGHVEKMRENGEWGTQTELAAAATMFGVCIYTFHEERWKVFRPLFRWLPNTPGVVEVLKSGCGTRQGIFLDNSSSCHYDVVLDVEPFVPNPKRAYDLVGVVNHFGRTVDSGHYRSHVLVKEDDKKEKWLLCDDETCEDADLKQVLDHAGSNGYLLLYRRHDLIGQ